MQDKKHQNSPTAFYLRKAKNKLTKNNPQALRFVFVKVMEFVKRTLTQVLKKMKIRRFKTSTLTQVRVTFGRHGRLWKV